VVFRRNVSTIKSDKHEITWSDLAIDASAVKTKTLAFGVQPGNKNISTEVVIKSRIKFIYLELNFAAETITNPKVLHWFVHFNRSGEVFSVPSLYYQTDRARIIQRGMEMLPKDVSTVFKRIIGIKIPKHLQSIQSDQNLSFSYIVTSAEAVNVCGFAIYKELY